MRIDFLYGSSYTTIDSNYITELSQEANLFIGETFYLGSTVCRSFKLSVDRRAINSLPDDSVIIYEGNDKYADLVIDSIDDSDVKVYTFNLTDRMVRLNNTSIPWYIEGATIQQQIDNICAVYNITSATIPEYGSVPIGWFDNWSARDFISWVAELLGGYAYIDSNNTLVFADYIKPSADIIDVEDCDSFKLGEQITIDRVVYDTVNKTVIYPAEYSGNGCTLYLHTENALFTDNPDINLSIEDQVEYIYNKINGFNFYNISVGKCPIDGSILAGDILRFRLNNVPYNTIAQVNWNYNSKWLGGYDLNILSPTQQETEIVGAMAKTLAIIQVINREIGEVKTSVIRTDERVGDLENSFSINTAGLRAMIQAVNEQLEVVSGYIDYIQVGTTSGGDPIFGLVLGQSTDTMETVITNQEIDFSVDDVTKAWVGLLGLGTPTMFVGDKENQGNQWRHEVVGGNNDNGLFYAIHRHTGG